MQYSQRKSIRLTSEIILGAVFLVCGCAIYLLFRSKNLNIYHWCSELGISSSIDTLRYTIQFWNVSEFVKFSLPDGLYSAAYILIIDAIWHNDKGTFKNIIISLVPIVAISSEILQYFELVKGTFDICDLTCYFFPYLIYISIQLVNSNIFNFLNHIKV